MKESDAQLQCVKMNSFSQDDADSLNEDKYFVLPVEIEE
jgi:hypothetical protein